METGVYLFRILVRRAEGPVPRAERACDDDTERSRAADAEHRHLQTERGRGDDADRAQLLFVELRFPRREVDPRGEQHGVADDAARRAKAHIGETAQRVAIRARDRIDAGEVYFAARVRTREVDRPSVTDRHRYGDGDGPLRQTGHAYGGRAVNGRLRNSIAPELPALEDGTEPGLGGAGELPLGAHGRRDHGESEDGAKSGGSRIAHDRLSVE